MKNGVFWDVTLRSVRRLLVTASVVPSSPILITLKKEALSSSETSVLTIAIRRHSSTNIHPYSPKSYFCLLDKSTS
jgi:thiazole synthase ThiGH ThiG subunit